MASRGKQRKTSKTQLVANRRAHGHKRDLIPGAVCILLAVIVWIAFGQTLRHEFVNYDDGAYVYANSRITNGLTPGNVAWAFTHVHAANWHPLTTISHMLDCQFYGLQPWGHHLTNVLLQTAAVILLFLALWRLSENLWPSAFVAALFGVHPLRVESVAWVAERKDVLSGVFFMLTLLAYARYVRGGCFSLGRYATVLVLFALGLMCKPTLVTLPFVLLLLDYWPLRRTQKSNVKTQSGESWSRLVVEKIPFFVLSALSSIATVLAQKEALAPAREVPLQERFANAVVAYVDYVVQMVYPANLAVLYPYPKGGPNIAAVLVALVLLAIGSLIFFHWRKTYPFVLVGWLWFLGMLVPMIGIVQVGSQPIADRYTYLPQIGLYIAVGWGATQLFKSWQLKPQLMTAAACLVVGALIIRSYFQTQYWRDSETLWSHTVGVTHDNYIAQNNLGGTLLEKGRLNDAVVHYRAALDLNPDVAQVQSNLGNALLQQGEIGEAITHLQKALEINPTYAEAYNYMGDAAIKKGQPADAIGYYQKAIELDKSYADAHNNLAVAFLRSGDFEQAIAHYKQAVAIKPGSAEMQSNLGNALARKGDWAGAIASYQAALSAEHDSAKAARILNNLGGALERIGKSDEAFEQFTKAVQMNANYPEARCNLARMLAQQGRRDEAIGHLQQALRLRPGYGRAREQLRDLGVEAGQ